MPVAARLTVAVVVPVGKVISALPVGLGGTLEPLTLTIFRVGLLGTNTCPGVPNEYAGLERLVSHPVIVLASRRMRPLPPLPPPLQQEPPPPAPTAWR